MTSASNYRDPSDPTSAYTPEDQKLIDEIPFILDFYERYPLSRLDTLDIACCYDEAHVDVREEVKLVGFNLSPTELQEKVIARAWEYTEIKHTRDVYERAALIENDHQDQMEFLVEEVQHSVDRSAVLADMVETAQRHPFLTAIVGTWLMGKLSK